MNFIEPEIVSRSGGSGVSQVSFSPVTGRGVTIPINQVETISQAQPLNLIVDGIIGYSLKGAPRGAAAQLIQWANAQNVPTLALDAPSGIDTTTGTVFDPAIQATATLTLALPKAGLQAPGVEACVGELYLDDISVPPALYTKPVLSLQVEHLFAKSDIIRLR